MAHSREQHLRGGLHNITDCHTVIAGDTRILQVRALVSVPSICSMLAQLRELRSRCHNDTHILWRTVARSTFCEHRVYVQSNRITNARSCHTHTRTRSLMSRLSHDAADDAVCITSTRWYMQRSHRLLHSRVDSDEQRT